MELDEPHEGESLSEDWNRHGPPQPVGELTTRQSRETAEQQRRAAALRMGSLAAAAQHAAGDLEEQFPQAARYMHDAASGFQRISNLLRDPNLEEVATLIGNLGRRQPAAIVAGVVLIGLGLSWFLKSASDADARSAADAPAGGGEGGAYGIH